jgi:chaperonin GroEL
MADYQKVKSVAKVIATRGPDLNKKILKTMQTISSVVGSTLGPGGMPVLIERQEFGLPALVTKDGVTVFRALGFSDSIEHSVMESARDAAVRTVSEAGDGTTTATVLAEAIVRFTHEYILAHPRVSPQKVVRTLESTFRDRIQPLLSANTRVVGMDNRDMLLKVATVSANGDKALAEAVMECFDVVGDAGNVTITEQSGPSAYKVEKIDGYPVPMGYEESCMKFMNLFINDRENQRTFLEKPYYVLYHGVIGDIQSVVMLLDRLGYAYQNVPNTPQHDANMPSIHSPNVVIVATGFSESVVASLASNFIKSDTLNIVPLLTPRSPIMNGELHFLQDLAAVTGATIFDPLTKGLHTASEQLEELGWSESFEMYRFRSTVVGHRDEDEVLFRAEELQAQINNAESELDKRLLQERLAKVTGGIARLRVIGASNGELREKKDRADDAVCAVRGAIKSGILPGGGWALVYLAHEFQNDSNPIVSEILVKALLEPVIRLHVNCGLSVAESAAIIDRMERTIVDNNREVYDCLNEEFEYAYDSVVDSAPAVVEAIRNSVSIASLLGSLGGVVVFPRDAELERRESSANSSFLRDIESGDMRPANERA